MSRFSVKKPMTVFVAVVLVIVLGVVAFIKMTPDLLPDMDFPYVVVMTTYTGASPEKVESTVTKPIEQAAATLDDIKEVSSSSNENYSLVILEFSNSVNMDAATMNLREKLDQLSGTWPDEVGSSTILKINPNMLPVNISAVSLEGYDTVELTKFVNDTLLPRLEGVEGVAAVSASGAITESVEVTITDEKIEALNGKIRAAIDKNFEEPLKEISDGWDEIESNEELLSSSEEKLESGQQQLDSGKASTEAQFAEAQAKIDEGRKQLDAYVEQANALTALINTVNEQQASLDEMKAQRAAIPDEGRTAEQEALAAQLDGQIQILEATVAGMKAKMPSDEDIQAAMGLLQTAEQQYAQLDEAQNQLDDAKSQAKIEMTNAQNQLDSGAYQIAEGKEKLKEAKAQLDEARKTLDEKRQEAYDAVDAADIVTMSTVSQLLAAQNFAMPAGYVTENGENWLVYVGDNIGTFEELDGLILLDLGMDGLEPITLGEVADVKLVDDSDETFAMINGSDGVLLSFSKQSNCATATVSDNIISEFEDIKAEYEGFDYVPLMDQGDYIHLVIDSVLDNLVIGAVLAIIILFLFLRDLRPTVIVACSIPISVTFAIVLMYFSGVTLNIISMSGLAVAVGMLVDNSIVVIENIYRLRKNGETVFRASISGAAQVAGAITASTLTTVCVFVPIVFVEGLTRQIFQDMALTIGYSLMASLIIALTLIPAMASGIMKRTRDTKEGKFAKLTEAYKRTLTWTLSHKAIVIILCVVLLAVSAFGAVSKGFVYIPEMDSTQISVSVKLDEDVTVSEAKSMAGEIYERISALPDVNTVGVMQDSGTAGIMGMSVGGGDPSNLTMYVVLDEAKKESSAVIAKKIEESCADLDCEVSAAGSGMDMSMLTGSGVTVNVFGEDLDGLRSAADEVASVLATVPGIKTVSDGSDVTSPELKVTVNKAEAVKHGLTTAQVYMEIVNAITNTKSASTIESTGDSITVIADEDGKHVGDVRDLVITVTKQDGTTEDVKLSDIADIEETESMQSIRRIGQRRYISVTAEIEDGYNVTLVTADVQEALKDYETPSGIRVVFDGENEQIVDALKDLLLMMLLGVIIVYLIMVAQFQSLLSPFIVMFTIPLAFTGGLIALLIAGYEISIVSMIGFILLVGIIVNNGIVLIDCMNQLRQGGMERREAVVESCVMRMRPVLMTALTTILGLIPMAIGSGLGASIIQPVAVVAIGGLVYATFMTLFVVPIIYDAWCKKPLRVVTKEDMTLVEE